MSPPAPEHCAECDGSGYHTPDCPNGAGARAIALLRQLVNRTSSYEVVNITRAAAELLAEVDKIEAPAPARVLKCSGWCSNTGAVTHVDRKGYTYCEPCGLRRRASAIPCRKLRPAELRQLQQGRPLKRY